MTETRKPDTENYEGFSAEERAAMKERAQELKKAAQRDPASAKSDGENDVLAKIAEMAESDRVLAERIHEIVMANAPDLTPMLHYGMPAYAKDEKVLCYFQDAAKFNARYATFTFDEKANLDDGTMWPVGFALTEMTAANEAKIADLVRRAAS